MAWGIVSRLVIVPTMEAPDRSLPRWLSLWLIGWQHRREGEMPPPDPPALLAQWREQGADAEQRLLLRARHHLGPAAARLAPLPRRLGWALAGLCLLLGLASATGVWSLLGTGERPVNVVWTWLALLGPHVLMFLLWLLSLVLGGAPPWAGRTLAALGERLPGMLPERAVAEAAWDGLQASGATRWLLSALSHLLWLAALAGALIGLLLALSLRRYGFTWETTILPAAWFDGLVGTLAWLPSLLGLPQPDAALVAASAEGPVASSAARRAWSFWLLGGLILYGVLPRLVALLVCRWRLKRTLGDLRVPWQQPYYAVLQRRLSPRSSRLGVVDADAGDDAPLPFLLGGVGEGAAVLGIDLPTDWPWPLATGGVRDLGRCEQREQRAVALQALTDAPAAKLLVVVEAAQSPDRGSLRFLAELCPHTRRLGVLLAGPDRDQRRALWRQSLSAHGLAAADILDSEAAARAWLQETMP
jgi:hypothetical protein